MADLHRQDSVITYEGERIRCREAVDTWLQPCKLILYDEVFFIGHCPKAGDDRDLAAMIIGLIRGAYGDKARHPHQDHYGQRRAR